ncbi:hypothetical protein ACFR9R_04785, partial [Putridiphycobacter roseus]
MKDTLELKCFKSNSFRFRASNLLFTLIFVLPIFFPQQLFAEGTKEVMPTATNGVGLYVGDANSSGPFFNSPDENKIRFEIADHVNENFYFGGKFYDRVILAQRGDVYIRIKDGSGTVVYGPQLFPLLGTGHIADYTEAVAGPNIAGTAPTGYTPLSFDPTANGEYFIEIYSSLTAGISSTNEYVVGVFFDFTVATNAGVRKSGRISCQKWSFLTYNPSNFEGDLNYSFNGDYYAYTKDSSIIRMEFANGFKPFGYELAMNYYGVINTGSFIYDRKSVISPAGAPPLNNGYKTFLNLPDTLVFIPTRTAPSPVLTNQIYGCPGEYYIPYYIQSAGDLALLLDINGIPGYQSATSDKVIEIYGAAAGNGIIAWDGFDGLGNPVLGGANINLQATLFKGRTNIPMYDAEINANGFQVTSIFPLPGSKKLYWDDSDLVNYGTCANILTDNNTGAGYADINLLEGVFGPQHAWDGAGPTLAVPAPNLFDGSTTVSTCDDFGNARTINTWFYSSNVASGLVAKILPNCDNDNDGITDDLDLDDDNDGILDLTEHSSDPLADHDFDGFPNYIDAQFPGFVDSNFDLINDNFDLDLDGIINSFDIDADGDNCSDVIEAGYTDVDGNGEVDGTGLNANGTVSGSDGYGALADDNSNGTDDYLEINDQDGDGLGDKCDADRDGDGIPDIVEGTLDSDGDGIPNNQDLDSDNDGVSDLVEAGGTDANGDGVLDDVTDTDGDGIPDLVDPDNGGTVLTIPDSDNDGLIDALDVDSDNDGIADVIENGGTDPDGDGQIGTGPITDTDGDGLSDIVDTDNGGTALTNPDTDLDGLIDALDIDSDNDGIVDAIEAGGTDADGDGQIGSGVITDTDGDGMSDIVDTDDAGTPL